MIVSLFVPGVPIAQPRPRRAKHGGVYNPKTADSWKALIVLYARQNRAYFDGAVKVELAFIFPIPKSRRDDFPPFGAPVSHISKPDLDNCQKSVLDALTTARVWQDDACVYDIRATKFYGDNPGVKITIQG